MSWPTVSRILAVLDELARRPLWPGFDPRATPLVIYDGQDTWLTRHPHPPAPFRWRPEATVWGMTGLHDSVRASTATRVDGVPTAALMLAAPLAGLGPSELAAACIHEAFHVFQADQYPNWVSDTGAMFRYPLGDVSGLVRRRLETEAWRRAQSAENASARRGWALAALRYRRQRFLGLPVACAAFERGTELSEGLAQYVEYCALGRTWAEVPLAGWAPDQIRLRCYTLGAVMARLLDDVMPQWQRRIGAAPSLDALLAEALAGQGDVQDFTPAEHRAIGAVARQDSAAAERDRQNLLASLSSAGGPRVIVHAATPLRPLGLDPSNCRQLDVRQLLHTRWLHVGSGRLDIEMRGGKALTRAAGEHPLYSGFAEVVLFGAAEVRELGPGAQRLAWHGDGVSIIGEVDRVRTEGEAVVLDVS